ncbi:hypothetical protein [Lentilactobacillus sp. Marseille-Q4993]|uniref:hypothetical protein n=1 Tax=Lentilactobacillus sp. Marseille-Q4993 TaxID=3039492 RepID=UPI0024BC2FDF|nr:hypothetical protein [Lentilactobacillus sp. Marseille-Q4993]
MAKPRLVLYKEKEVKNTRLVNIDADLHAQLLDLKHDTGLSITKIVERFIAYGIKNVEIEERRDNE